VDEGRVVDHVGGKADLSAGWCGPSATPDVRMREDPVRILRAIRFAANCAFDLEPGHAGGDEEARRRDPALRAAARAGRGDELLRSGASRRSFELLREVHALRILLPPVAAYLERSGPVEAERHLRRSTLWTRTCGWERSLGRRAAGDAARAAARSGARAGRSPRAGEAAAAGGEACRAGEDDELESELTALEEGQDAPEKPRKPTRSRARAADRRAALVEAAELHDERLGGFLPFRWAATCSPGRCRRMWWRRRSCLPRCLRTARLPRRIAERARMILLAQPILAGDATPAQLAAALRGSYFPEALAVFERRWPATGQDRPTRQVQAAFAGQDLSKLEPGRGARAGARSRPRRRRRRGGRGRRGHAAHPKPQIAGLG